MYGPINIKLKRRPGMLAGYKFPIETCEKCGAQVPTNWMIRHLKSGCQVPKPRIYEATENQRE